MQNVQGKHKWKKKKGIKSFTESLPWFPPKTIWASTFFSNIFKSSTTWVTMEGTVDVVPQPLHSSRLIAASPLLTTTFWDSLEEEWSAAIVVEKGFEESIEVTVLLQNCWRGKWKELMKLKGLVAKISIVFFNFHQI